MDAGKANAYDSAVNWLKIVRDILLRIDKKTSVAGVPVEFRDCGWANSGII